MFNTNKLYLFLKNQKHQYSTYAAEKNHSTLKHLDLFVFQNSFVVNWP